MSTPLWKLSENYHRYVSEGNISKGSHGGFLEGSIRVPTTRSSVPFDYLLILETVATCADDCDDPGSEIHPNLLLLECPDSVHKHLHRLDNSSWRLRFRCFGNGKDDPRLVLLLAERKSKSQTITFCKRQNGPQRLVNIDPETHPDFELIGNQWIKDYSSALKDGNIHLGKEKEKLRLKIVLPSQHHGERLNQTLEGVIQNRLEHANLPFNLRTGLIKKFKTASQTNSEGIHLHFLRIKATFLSLTNEIKVIDLSPKILNKGRSNFTNEIKLLKVSPRRVCESSLGKTIITLYFEKPLNQKFIQAKVSLGSKDYNFPIKMKCDVGFIDMTNLVGSTTERTVSITVERPVTSCSSEIFDIKVLQHQNSENCLCKMDEEYVEPSHELTIDDILDTVMNLTYPEPMASSSDNISSPDCAHSIPPLFSSLTGSGPVLSTENMETEGRKPIVPRRRHIVRDCARNIPSSSESEDDLALGEQNIRYTKSGMISRFRSLKL